MCFMGEVEGVACGKPSLFMIESERVWRSELADRCGLDERSYSTGVPVGKKCWKITVISESCANMSIFGGYK